MSALRRLHLGFSLILLFGWNFPAWAADWPAIAPEDLKMTELPEQKGAPAFVLLREEVADNPNNNFTVYERIKILTEAGRKYADVEIPYSRANFTIQGVAGRTIHADGSVVPFEGQVFDKVVVRGKRGRGIEIRVHVKSFSLPDVQVGSILDYRYTIRYADRVFYTPEWIIQKDLFQRKASFKFIPYPGDLIMAHERIGRGVQWTSYLPSGGPQPKWHEILQARYANKRAPDQYIDLTMTNIPSIVDEPYMPPKGMIRYQVRFYYMVGQKQEEFWKDEGKFWNKDVEKFLDHKDGVAEAVSQVVSSADTPEQKVRKIYAFVGTLENQSYRPQREEQEEKVIGLKMNEGAADVLRQRSGDHDDLNRLFAAMVRAAGIPADMMWVSSREETFFQPELLSTRQLDSEIVIVRLGDKDVFLDPGTKYCPYGLLDWRLSGTKGLRQVAGRGTEIAESPLTEYNQAQIQRLAQLTLNDEGRAEGTIRAGFYGLEAMDRRQKGANTDAEGKRKLLEDEVKSWLPGDSEVTLVGTPNWDDTEKHLTTEFKVSCPMAISAGKRWLVPVHIFQVNSKPVFAASDRVNGVYFWYQSREIDEVRITLPASLEVESLPPNDNVKLDYALYSTTQKQSNASSIVARRDLVMGGLAFPPSEYKQLKTFYDKVKAGDDQQMIVRGAAHAEVK